MLDLNTGDTAWVLTASAVILMMTLPGIGLFYGGMSETKNVLTTIMQSFTIACLITIIWFVIGYSLAFGPAESLESHGATSVFGDGSRFWLLGMDLHSSHQLAEHLPEAVFCVFQLTFAIITAALIMGSFADRIKYSSMILFIVCWHLLVYCPIGNAFSYDTFQFHFTNKLSHSTFCLAPKRVFI